MIGDRIEGLIAAQLGRRPRGLRGVAVWCPYGFPAVIETLPYLEDGTPFPTLLYLTCPSAVLQVSRHEDREGVGQLRERLAADPDATTALLRLELAYRRRRRTIAPRLSGVDGGAVFEGGIGGVAGPAQISCLHALTAALLAGVDDWPGLTGPASVNSAPAAAPESEFVSGSASPSDLDAWRRLLREMGELWCSDVACSSFVPPNAVAAAQPVPGERALDAAGPAETAPLRAAAVDVGTMSTRLLIADVVDGRPEDVLRRAVITRLGESLGAEGRLLPEAKERTAQTVAAFVAQARALGAVSITLVGTSAVRDALDGKEFLHGLGHSQGVPALVATGELEAGLAYAGATLDVPGTPVLLDIGGGSTELVQRGEDGRLHSVSLQLGSVRSTERWVCNDPPLSEELAAVRDEAERLLRDYAPGFSHGNLGESGGLGQSAGFGADPPILVGVAGTVTTMACVHLGLQSYDARLTHLSSMTSDDLDRHILRLSRQTARERLAESCMQPGREEVILAGAEILRAVMAVLEFDRIVVSERDLLDGIILYTRELQALTLTSL